MDAGARARRDVLSARGAALLASLLVACAEPRARGGAPGGPAPAATAGTSRTQPEAALVVPADPASLKRLTSESVRSRGHGGGLYQLAIFANEAGAKLWRERSGRASPRALFVALHQSVADASPGPVLLMQKQDPGYDPNAADWQFGWAEPPTALVRSGRLADCAACHAGAETDYVFITE